jgi:hypothetical protein
VSFAAITLCVTSYRVFIVVVYFVMTQSGNFWIHPRTYVSIVIQLTVFIDGSTVQYTKALEQRWDTA